MREYIYIMRWTLRAYESRKRYWEDGGGGGFGIIVAHDVSFLLNRPHIACANAINVCVTDTRLPFPLKTIDRASANELLIKRVHDTCFHNHSPPPSFRLPTYFSVVQDARATSSVPHPAGTRCILYSIYVRAKYGGSQYMWIAVLCLWRCFFPSVIASRTMRNGIVTNIFSLYLVIRLH